MYELVSHLIAWRSSTRHVWHPQLEIPLNCSHLEMIEKEVELKLMLKTLRVGFITPNFSHPDLDIKFKLLIYSHTMLIERDKHL